MFFIGMLPEMGAVLRGLIWALSGALSWSWITKAPDGEGPVERVGSRVLWAVAAVVIAVLWFRGRGWKS